MKAQPGPLVSGRPLATDAREAARAGLRYVYEQSLPGMFVNVAISGLLCLALWDHVDHGLLLLGWGSLTAVSAVRLLVRARFLRADPGFEEAGWLAALWAGLLVTAALWGIGSVVLIEHAPIEHQFLIAIVLCGMGAGGIAYLAPIRGLYPAYVIALLGPISVWFWLQQGSAWKPMAGMTIVFGIALLSTARSFSRSFRQVSSLSTALVDSDARFASAFENAPVGMMLIDDEGRVVDLNREAARLYGTELDDWRGTPFWQRADDRDADALRARFATFQSGASGAFSLETRQRTKAGDDVRAHVHASTVPERVPGGVFAIVQIQDVTRARELADRLAHQATHDALTDLVNRRELEARLERALETVRVDRASHAVLFIDIDNFKVVNDSCGHAAGDALLVEISRLLTRHVRRHDTVARLGGDEFAILLEHCAADRAAELGAKLCRAVDELRFRWHEKLLRTSLSIGVVDLSSAGTSVLEAMNAADGACYAAKSGGRNRVYVFRPDDAELAQRQGEIDSVAQLTRALEHDEFVLFAQPMQRANATPGTRVTHLEILVRMRGEAGQVRMPGQFLPAAERYGLAPKLDRWVVAHTLRWFAGRPAVHAQVEHCAINLSGQSVMDPAFETFLVRCFEETGVDPARFCFEITETAAVSNIGHAQRFIGRVSALGCRFALDDFGSGVSSLGYLKALPVNVLKIDGIFVRDLLVDPVNSAMIRAVSDIARTLRMETVAEFVENQEQLRRLAEIGVDFVQGYLVGRPKPIGDVLGEGEAAHTAAPRTAAL